jgi:hypothetical protein
MLLQHPIDENILVGFLAYMQFTNGMTKEIIYLNIHYTVNFFILLIIFFPRDILQVPLQLISAEVLCLDLGSSQFYFTILNVV